MTIADVAEFLHNNNQGVFLPDDAGGDIFVGDMPDKPDDAICVYDSPGPAPSVKLAVREPGVQIIVRGIDRRATYARAQAVFDLLHATREDSFIAGSPRIIMCQARQAGPIFLERDENRRVSYSLNFQLILGG